MTLWVLSKDGAIANIKAMNEILLRIRVVMNDPTYHSSVRGYDSTHDLRVLQRNGFKTAFEREKAGTIITL